MDRRTFLRSGLAAGAAAIAGCLDGLETESVWTGGPIVEDRPDGVYLPAAAEEMATVATTELADGARLSVHYTYPHRFWTVTGEDRTLVSVQEGELVHLMTSVWDPQTSTVLPRRPRATLLRDGEALDGYQLWPMLAQRMGYHFGNNVALGADGDYEVQIDLDPLAVRGLGAFDGAFDAATSETVVFEFARQDVLDLAIEEVPRERRGTPDAHAPMDGMGPPPGRVPQVEELPGELLGSGRNGDFLVAGTVLDAAPDGLGHDGPYLAVSPRTPYNRVALPGCSLVADVGDSTSLPLTESVHEALGHHYGSAVDAAPGQSVTVRVETPPQVARHDGYETAFFDVAPVELS